MGPLSGVRILDLTSVMMGPYATQLLGDMGAEVLKVESPDGDIVRQIGPGRSPGMGGMFLQLNRSKRSIVLDLKKPSGKAALMRIAASCDVLMYNLRPQVMQRLGLGYEEVAKARPDIIYAGLFGYGQDGPYGALPAYDDLIQGASAIPSLIAQAGDGTPRYVPLTMADRVVGLHAVNAVLAALFHRQKTGEGQRSDIPMCETMASFVLGDHLGGLTYDPPLDKGGYPRLLSKHRAPYRTSDGHICALIYNDKHWRNFFAAIGQPEKASDPRYANHGSRIRHIDAIYEEAAAVFATRSTAEWKALLDAADIPVMPLHTLESLLEDPHLAACGFFRPVEHPSEGAIRTMRVPSRWTATQPDPQIPAPRLGEQTRAILREAGLSDTDIDELLTDGAAIAASEPEEMETR
jgi:crotonobetainyl-CoA:carnitine CoA-transferase CaiB-like acyl-CoA transferase